MLVYEDAIWFVAADEWGAIFAVVVIFGLVGFFTFKVFLVVILVGSFIVEGKWKRESFILGGAIANA